MLIDPQALRIVVDFLTERHIPYMVIGGLANAIWGEMWAEIQKEDWESIRKMLRAVAQHKIWTVRVGSEALPALASTRQGDWQELLLKGRLPGREKEMFPKLDQNFIFQAGVS